MTRLTLEESIARTGIEGLRYHAKRSLCPEIRVACAEEVDRRMAGKSVPINLALHCGDDSCEPCDA